MIVPINPHSKPLSGLRLIVTLPPPGFFGGLDRRRAEDHAAALRAIGASVYEFETQAIYGKDRAMRQRQIAEMRAFAANAVIGTQHAGYAIQGGLIDELDLTPGRSSQNLFLDTLELPTVLYWDHVLTQAARYIIPSWPSLPDESTSGVIQQLRRLMTHPLAVHFVPDSGHAAELVRMGAVAFHHDPLFVTAVSELFVQHGLEGHGSPLRPEKVSFFGNLYFAATEQSPYRDRADLLKLRQAALVRCEADWDLAPYQAYRTAIADMPADIRASLKLDPDQSFHWRFLYDELSIVANGEHRFRLLDTCKLPIAFYGGFADPASRATIADRAWLPRESLPYGRPLAEAYRSTSITLDVVNAPFINGFSPKLLECYAAGGFLLTTRKRDIATAFGGLADAIGYSSADELTAKIDYYLTHDSERRSVTRDMQEIIRHNYTASALFARTLPVAVESLRARRT